MVKVGTIKQFAMEIVMIKYKIIALAGLTLLLLFFSNTLFQNFSLNNVKKKAVVDTSTKEDVYVGVVSRYAPPLIYRGYQPIMDYLTANTNYHFVLKLSDSYNDTIEDLVNKKISIAFVGTFIYLEMHEKDKLIPILCPKNKEGFPISNAVLISKDNVEFKGLCNLTKTKVALPSEKSFSSNWFLKYYKLKCGELKKTNISITYFNYHTSVIFQVLKGNYQFGVVKQNIADAFKDRGIKILLKSHSIPSSPIVVKEGVNKQMLDEFTNALIIIEKTNPNILNTFDKEFAYGFAKTSPEKFIKEKNLIFGVVDEQ